MKKKILFIDRDGTIIQEPPVTFQVDTLEQLSFLPGAIRNLYKICNELDYKLVMVSNQDGLGTSTYPQERFDIIQNKMLEILLTEGVEFDAIHIDTSFEYENKPSRKPGIDMLTRYLGTEYDLTNSYVIGDRLTDVKLAKNLGARAIFIKNYDEPDEALNIDFITNDWDNIYKFLKNNNRKAFYQRDTNETKIIVEINLDGDANYSISTGLGFFDHMLEQIARHGNIDLKISTQGDLHIDEHHTIEDTAIALGAAFAQALGDKKGIERYGFVLPMDDCLAQVALDFGNRGWLIWEADFKREKIGDMPTEMFYHFFRSFSEASKCNLNIKAEGTNEHHKIETIFKAFARAIKQAVRIDTSNMKIPSTKGIL